MVHFEKKNWDFKRKYYDFYIFVSCKKKFWFLEKMIIINLTKI